MDTKLINCKHGINQDNVQVAAELLRAGEAVAFPTETVYGIGANALDEAAVAKIFAAKGRPSDNPLNVLVPSKAVAFALAKDVPGYVEKLMEVFSPGPITYVLTSAGKVAPNVTANLSTVGVRIPDNDIALQLLREVDLPLAAPSANISGKPSPTTANHVIEDLTGKVAAIIDGGPTNVGVESTVVDCTGATPVIIRTGVITAEDIQHVIGECRVAPGVQIPSHKYKHYQPEVPLILVMDKSQLPTVIAEQKAAGKRVGVLTLCHEQIELADQIYPLEEEGTKMVAQLYDTLRSLKKADVDVVISTTFSSQIVMDRLKSAAKKIV